MLYDGDFYAISNSFASIEDEIVFLGSLVRITFALVSDSLAGLIFFFDLGKCFILPFDAVGELACMLLQTPSFGLL